MSGADPKGKKVDGMKIIALVVSNLSGGGAQRVVSTLSAGLSDYYRVYLVVHDGRHIDYSYRGELIDLRTPPAGGIIKKVITFFKRIRALKKFKRELKPVSMISFMESSNFINLLSGSAGKTIVSVRNYKSKQGNGIVGKVFSLLIKRLYHQSTYVIAASKGIKFDLVESFGLKEETIKVIYNPYDLNYIRERSEAELTDSFKEHITGFPVIITAGSLDQQKGQWQLIRAFRLVKEKHPEARLIILGEGILRPVLEELVVKLGLEGSVSMPGFEENPFKFLGKADLFVLPSLYEGFPNVLVEAMACGLPVIAADCPSGPREILAPKSKYDYQAEDIEQAEYGVLIPVGEGKLKKAEEELSKSEMAMVQAICDLCAKEELKVYYQEKSLERAMHFNLETIVKQWVQVIES